MREQFLVKLKKAAEESWQEILIEHPNTPYEYDDTYVDLNSDMYLSIGRYITVEIHPPHSPCPLHGHEYIEIMYVCSGQVTHDFVGNSITMKAGDILFMNQNVKHSIRPVDIDDICVNFIILPEFFDIPLTMLKDGQRSALAEFLIGTLRINEERPQYLHFKTGGNYAVENLMENLIQPLLEDKYNATINQFTMGLLFLHLLDNIEAISDDSLQSGYDVMAEATLQYINQRYKDASLNELASNMYQSQSNMSKIIKKSTGYSFSELLQRKRFQQAVLFLTDTNMTVAEIMHAVGYENSSFFYKRFRDKYGMSPRDYRLSQKHDNKIRA